MFACARLETPCTRGGICLDLSSVVLSMNQTGNKAGVRIIKIEIQRNQIQSKISQTGLRTRRRLQKALSLWINKVNELRNPFKCFLSNLEKKNIFKQT